VDLHKMVAWVDLQVVETTPMVVKMLTQAKMEDVQMSYAVVLERKERTSSKFAKPKILKR